jgi:alanine racemase
LDFHAAFAPNSPTVQPTIRVEINLAVVRGNIERIKTATGVPVIAVVKADAYGLGAARIIPAIDDLVAGYYVLQPREVIDSGAHRMTDKRFIAAVCESYSADDLIAHRIRPAVWTIEQALRWRDCDPVIAVDTGQQRFACPPENVQAVVAAGACREAYTHASQPAQVEEFDEITRGLALQRHAAGTSLLATPAAWFDAVRPGFAMYRGAVRVTTRLMDVRESRGPAGYSGFESPYHGVMLGGYSDGLAAGVCLINGQRRKLLEIGMQSAFVELTADDRAGDEVTLLGGELGEADVAAAWRCGTHEALFRLARSGERVYTGA